MRSSYISSLPIRSIFIACGFKTKYQINDDNDDRAEEEERQKKKRRKPWCNNYNASGDAHTHTNTVRFLSKRYTPAATTAHLFRKIIKQ